MKFKKGFILREIAGQNVLSAESIELLDFNKLISLNTSATFLWKELQDKDFDEEIVAQLLMKEYEIESDLAHKDASNICLAWKEAGLID